MAFWNDAIHFFVKIVEKGRFFDNIYDNISQELFLFCKILTVVGQIIWSNWTSIIYYFLDFRR